MKLTLRQETEMFEAFEIVKDFLDREFPSLPGQVSVSSIFQYGVWDTPNYQRYPVAKEILKKVKGA